MKIRKCTLIINDNGAHAIHHMDVIEHDGGFWLVPEWLDNPAQKLTTPLRIVSLEALGGHRMAGESSDFLVELPVPKYVFDGRIPPEEAGKYVVVESPEIYIPRDPRAH
jgi:hypothetical protein